MRRMKRTAAALALLSLSMGLVSGSAEARVQQAPSSRVALDLPDGYLPSPLFSGFINETLGASFVIVELPAAAYAELAKGMTAEALATKGVLNAAAARLERAEPYIYMRGEQQSAGGAFAKFMVVFQENGVTALVTANVRKVSLEQSEVREADIERVLATAAVAATAAPAHEVFALGYLGPFKPAGTLLGTTRAFTLDGRLEPLQKGQLRATLIVAPSLDRRAVVAADAFAEELLAGLPGIAEPKVDERRELKLAGLDAIEIVARATDKDGGGHIGIYQALLLPPGGGYYRIVGQMPLAEREQLLPELRKVAAGFRPLE